MLCLYIDEKIFSNFFLRKIWVCVIRIYRYCFRVIYVGNLNFIGNNNEYYRNNV